MGSAAMTWEIADRDHPERAGPRYPELARASEEAAKCEPTGRFYLRWVGPETSKPAHINDWYARQIADAMLHPRIVDKPTDGGTDDE